MNRPSCFIFFSLLLVSSFAFSQTGYLFVKKGFKKKRIYTEGDSINLRLQDGSYCSGTISFLRNDTLFINDRPVYRPEIREVLLKIKPAPPFPDVKTLLLIGGGATLVTAGLTISKQAKFKEALIAGLVIGYGPLLVRHFGSRFLRFLTRKKFRVGKKFHLQVLDFYVPRIPLRSF